MLYLKAAALIISSSKPSGLIRANLSLNTSSNLFLVAVLGLKYGFVA
ncbi:hypothetical protein D033_4232 [Vibrio parahaemolyticus B-265]|nr:hypothetical protein D040_3117 [Vibrio parahaemolyticus NIHCB0603]ETS20241.1 hypothetical protein D033_4232 [Vibrio parahaemolyticus B-265]